MTITPSHLEEPQCNVVIERLRMRDALSKRIAKLVARLSRARVLKDREKTMLGWSRFVENGVFVW